MQTLYGHKDAPQNDDAVSSQDPPVTVVLFFHASTQNKVHETHSRILGELNSYLSHIKIIVKLFIRTEDCVPPLTSRFTVRSGKSTSKLEFEEVAVELHVLVYEGLWSTSSHAHRKIPEPTGLGQTGAELGTSRPGSFQNKSPGRHTQAG